MAYIGQVLPVPVGVDGLTGNNNQSQHTPEQLIQANNITLRSGTLQKEGGAAKYNSTAITGTPSILAGWDWWPSSGTQRMVVVADDGKIYKDTGDTTFSVTLKSGLTLSAETVSFCEGGAEVAANNRKLFIFTGQNVVQVLSADAATTSDLATPPADWTGSTQPTFGVIHEDRLWGGGNSNDPHRIYYSTVSNHEDFTTSGGSGTGGAGSAGSLSIYPGEGEKIVGAISFRGFLVVFKYPVGIYAIDTTASDWISGSSVRVTKVTDQLGTLNSHTIMQIDNDVLFLSQGGNPHILSGVQQFGDLATSDIGNRVDFAEWVRNNTALNNLTKSQGVYYEGGSEAHIAMPGLGASTNSVRMVVDFNKDVAASSVDRFSLKTLPRFRWSDRDTPISMWLRKDTNNILRPVYGDATGTVWLMDQDSRSYGGTGYQGIFQSSHMDLSTMEPKFGTIRKLGDFLELVVEPKGNWNLSVDLYWDSNLEDTYQYNMGTTGATLGSFVLDTDKLAEEQVINKKRRITGSGRRFSIAGRNSGDGQDFSVGAFFLHFRPGDERLD
jgi:hypothetical protein